MKNNFIKSVKITFLIAGAVMVITGCGKIDDFGNTNVNPGGISTPPTSALLTNVQSQLGGIANNTRPATYAQYVSENQYTDVSLYQLPQIEMGGFYNGPLQDLQTIIDLNSNPATAGAAAVNGSNANQIATAKILKSYIYWIITDRWGDVPYSEALKGAAALYPKYDKQEDVYFGLMKELKEAVAGFDGGAGMKGDVMYAGNNAKWKKLGNSLRMIMAMRLTKKYPAAGGKAALEFADAANNAAGYINNNADNFVLTFPGGNFKNTWYLTYESRDDFAESKTLGDVLAGLGDTRQSVFGTNTITFPYGLTRDLAVQYANSVGNGQSRVLVASKRTQSSPVTIINASTVLLALAEGIERTWTTSPVYATAEAAYNAGVTANFAEWGLTIPAAYLSGPASYNAGGGVPTNIGAGAAPYDNFRAASNNVQDATTTTKLQRIALQRWLAAYPNGNEGWAEQRRTGMPNLKTTRFAQAPFVLRYVFGANDYSNSNAATTAAAAALPGGDKQDSKIWWLQ
jgi:Starch-binding associating with outer membrane